ncbi:hypothetical protein ABT124_43075 [Streptomyces sp. NPDC001982]|uniref:hypothetical protein n=1 Tax=Streptomyces sp. NPDC001982 TaxID=3154405 RepID=UPI0033310023
MSAETLAAQAATLTCLAGIAVSHPSLPGAYFVVSSITPNKLTVQLDSPSEVEAWRDALGVSAEEIYTRRIGAQPSIEFEATAYGVTFHVWATYEPATVEAVAS